MKRNRIIHKPEVGLNMELCCNVDFFRKWKVEMAHVDKSTSKSRIGYLLMYTGCMVTWAYRI